MGSNPTSSAKLIHRGTWPIVVQCRVLQVSASGFHQHRLRQAAEIGPNQPHRWLSDTALAVHIKAVFGEMKGAYGWPRIWLELAARGIRAGKERVRRMTSAGNRWRAQDMGFMVSDYLPGAQTSNPQCPAWRAKTEAS